MKEVDYDAYCPFNEIEDRVRERIGFMIKSELIYGGYDKQNRYCVNYLNTKLVVDDGKTITFDNTLYCPYVTKVQNILAKALGVSDGVTPKNRKKLIFDVLKAKW